MHHESLRPTQSFYIHVYTYMDLTFGLSRVDALSFVLRSLVFFLRTGELLADWSDSLLGTKAGDTTMFKVREGSHTCTQTNIEYVKYMDEYYGWG